MKKLEKLSLSNLSEVELNERKMSQILGGGNYYCQCGCNYEGQSGGSSTSDNMSANDAGGMYSDVCQEKPTQSFCSGFCESPTQFEKCSTVQDALCCNQNLFC